MSQVHFSEWTDEDAPGDEPVDADRAPIEALATRYLAEWRQGLAPSIDAYAAAHPELAEEIRRLFPFVVALEDLNPSSTIRFDPRRQQFAPGTRFGDFRLVRQVGRGGMGVVYEAEDIHSGRRVALKLVSDEVASEDKIWREPLLAAKLAHPRIVPVYTSGSDSGVRFYAMMLVPGIGLDRLIQWLREYPQGVTGDDIRRVVAGEREAPSSTLEGAQTHLIRRTSWVQFAKIGVQICVALGHAHTRGILHRDIKPANILLDPQGAVWITDFGLARPAELDPADDPYRAAGTLRYMAPEQLGGVTDERSEIYAVGVTLYELCTQRPAFEAPTKKELVSKIRKGRYAKPRQVQARLPRQLEGIIVRCLSMHPQRRYRNMDALRADLMRFIRAQNQRTRWPWSWMKWS
ncbi:MAG TPA: serine/threonine-protein kinase [Planctomycetaceae bacterium]|jgi:serine/threonine protein kinase|nr:serine/threonine-protein kinase [Planctomycetaceae bacterium]